MSLHNAEIKILKKSVKSILEQSYKDFEFILVDDINSDKVISYLNKIIEKDKRVLLIKNKKNIGLTKSLIKGIKSAKGQYLARQDADDISSKNRLEAQVNYLDQNPKTAILGTWYHEKTDYGYSRIKTPKDNSSNLLNELYLKNPICHSSAMFQKSFYNKTDGYNEKYKTCQDLDLWFQLSRVGKISVVEKNLVDRNLTSSSISLSYKSYYQILNALRIRMKNLFKNQFSLKLFLLIIIGAIYHLLITLLLPPFRAIKLIFKH